ncbi:MAG: DoxX family protein [Acidobacteriota bacterium]
MFFLNPVLQWLDRRRDYGTLFIRLVVGVYLIYGTQDNVFSYARMIEFRDFLAAHKFPIPLFSAYLSVYAQFSAGILYILGAFTRYAAAVMIINFIVAFVAVDLYQPYPRNFPAMVMLSSSLLLLFQGSGRPSVDAWLKSFVWKGSVRKR